MNWFMILNEFNEISILIRILLAMILGGLIGLEREKSKRPAGFRTHILVCVGACITALIGFFVWNETGGNNDPMRISAQVISGIGFLGVGTILVKEHDHITGLTTAAGLWATATIGIACGCGFYIGAFAGTLVVAVTEAVLLKLEARGRRKNHKVILYVEITGTEKLNEYIDWFNEELKAGTVMVNAPKTATSGNVGFEVSVPLLSQEETKKVLETIRSKEDVLFAMEIMKTKRKD
jgi:putative Mg2+ transporter-C (MgtC) family protein